MGISAGGSLALSSSAACAEDEEEEEDEKVEEEEKKNSPSLHMNPVLYKSYKYKKRVEPYLSTALPGNSTALVIFGVIYLLSSASGGAEKFSHTDKSP